MNAHAELVWNQIEGAGRIGTVVAGHVVHGDIRLHAPRPAVRGR